MTTRQGYEVGATYRHRNGRTFTVLGAGTVWEWDHDGATRVRWAGGALDWFQDPCTAAITHLATVECDALAVIDTVVEPIVLIDHTTVGA